MGNRVKQSVYILYLLLIFPLCPAMEPKHKKLHAEYLTNNHIIILSRKQCSIIDITTEKAIVQIKNLSNHDLAIHPNKKRFALFKEKNVTIYNTKTGKEEKKISIQSDSIQSAVFSPLEKTILLNCINTLQKYNYKTNTKEFLNYYLNQQIAHHPTQSSLCILKSDRILISNSTDLALKQKFCLHGISSLLNCQYSPKGSIIAVNNSHNVYFLSPKHSQFIGAIRNESKESIKECAFHPNGSVFTTLHTLPDQYILRYWDIDSSTCIKTSFFKEYIHHFSFSPHGNNILITYKKEFEIYQIPWFVICQLGTDTTKLLLSFFFLTNFTENIPAEVRRTIEYFLLETFKR